MSGTILKLEGMTARKVPLQQKLPKGIRKGLGQFHQIRRTTRNLEKKVLVILKPKKGSEVPGIVDHQNEHDGGNRLQWPESGGLNPTRSLYYGVAFAAITWRGVWQARAGNGGLSKVEVGGWRGRQKTLRGGGAGEVSMSFKKMLSGLRQEEGAYQRQ